jgi:signal transduction histidine kinase
VAKHRTSQGPNATAQPERDQTDESLRVERHRSDDAQGSGEQTADGVVRIARGRADAVHTAERQATDRDLSGERAQADTVHVDQREANEKMVAATILAQELMERAEEAQERAEQAERELRRVAEFRELFIGILGHDLRNPLGAITLAAAMLHRRCKLDAHDERTVARIVTSSQRMTRLIAQLLDLTRARLGGGLPIQPVEGNLAEICQNVVDEFDARIELKTEGDVTGIWDQDRLAELLSNLVGNAIQYAEPGTAVTVEARGGEAEIVVEVGNQGPAIPPDVLPFIFDAFRGAEQRRKSPAGNLGLGLYISKEIVLAHGGTLDAQSADGRTTLVVRLPRAPSGSG